MTRRILAAFVVAGLVGGMIEFFGTHWDIWFHFTFGRDSLFSNPHLLMLTGMFVMLAVGTIALLKARRSQDPLFRRAAALMAVVGASQIAALAIDEGWHRLFGQDAFIWSPPHLMIIFGFTASMAMLTAIAAGLAERSRLWNAGVAAAGALTLGAFFILLAESSAPGTRTVTAFLEHHRTQTHPHVAPWLALLMAPPMATMLFAMVHRLAGQGKRGAVLVVSAGALYTAIAWLPNLLLDGRRGSPEPPMLVVAGALVFAAAIALGGERRAWVGALLAGPALWTVERLLQTHYAWAAGYNSWVAMALSIGASLLALRTGDRVGERLKPLLARAITAEERAM